MGTRNPCEICQKPGKFYCFDCDSSLCPPHVSEHKQQLPDLPHKIGVGKKIPSETSDDEETGSLSTSRSTRSTGRAQNFPVYKVARDGVLSEENRLPLNTSLANLTLYDISASILQAQGLSQNAYSCYLYSSCGWPLAANIEQQYLVTAESVLGNEDVVTGLIMHEQSPRAPEVQDPLAGNSVYTVTYMEETEAICLSEGCSVHDLRVKLMWKLKVPLQQIEITDNAADGLRLDDDHIITQNEIDTKFMEIKIAPFDSTFGKIDDFLSGFDEKEMKKAYGYLYLLQRHCPEETRKALEFVASVFSRHFPPFLFALHLTLKSSNLSKSERVALFYGLNTMKMEFSQYAVEEAAKDFPHMIGLLYHLASLQTAKYTANVRYVDFEEIRARNTTQNLISEQAQKEENIYNLLKFHSDLQKVSVDSMHYRPTHLFQDTRLQPQCFLDFLMTLQKKYPFLMILHPRDVSNSSQERLTYHPNGELWICEGLQDSSHDIGLDRKAILRDVLTGTEFSLKKSELAVQVEQYLPKDCPRVVVSREPEEATVVIFDTSYSMINKYQRDDTNTRLDAAKIFFLLFAQKTVAYDYAHVISLCTFADTSIFQSDFTENMDSFLELIQSLKPDGETALYSAMNEGVNRLKSIKVKHSNIALRMMIISDGEDTASRVPARIVSELLIRESIIVDVFAVGGKCDLLKLISKRSGGLCYYTDSILDGVRTFEAETILKLSLRKPVANVYPAISSDAAFARMAAKVPFDQDPPEMIRPADIDGKVCSSFYAFERRLTDRTENAVVAKRVLRELARYNHDPHPDFALFPLSRNLFLWRGVVKGPEGSPYESGVFEFYLHFGVEYPVKPPEMRFLTSIRHPNITKNGKICHSIFNTDYTSQTSVREILNQVYSLMMTLDFSDYIVSNLHITLSINKEQYDEQARDWTLRYAETAKTKEQVIQEMMEYDDYPDRFRCAFSKQLMRDPVYSPASNKIFERRIIEDYIDRQGVDPITNIPLRKDQLKEDWRLKNEIYSLYPR